MSQRRPSQRFPYGYYKAENLAALFVVGLIFYAAYDILKRSIGSFFTGSTITMPLFALGVSLFSAIVSYIIAKYEEKVGKEISSQSLLANASESRTDILSSLAVSVGILFSYVNISYAEGIIGILISALILRIGYNNARAAILSLMDASPDPELEEEIRKMILNTKGAKDVKHLKLRRSGTMLFGDAHLKVSRNISVKLADSISKLIEKNIKKRYPEIMYFLTHVEPYKENIQKILIPIKDNKGLDSLVVSHFGRANFFFSAILKDGTVESYKIMKNPYIKKKIRAGLLTAKYVIKQKIDTVIIRQIGEIAYYTLKDNYVDIYKSKGRSVKEVIGNLAYLRLTILKRPTHTSE